MTPILGFAPDADSATPGVLTDCVNLIPSLTGMLGAPTAITPASTPALSATCLGCETLEDLSGDRRVFAGTATKLYELTGGAWDDVSRGATYTGSTATRWSFTQFGDASLAANRADVIQRATTGDFADISGAPKAEIIFSVGSFVMALNVNDGSEKPDGWHCSATFDETDWTEDIDTQCASGRLVSSPGDITAGASLGEYAVAYKKKSVYLGQYVGAPAVWSWQLIPGGESGCVGKNAVCDIGGAHFYVGADNFWLFDGSRPAPLADGVLRDWFFTNSNPLTLQNSICLFNRKTNRVWIFYPSTTSTVLDSALVFHVTTKRFGRANMTIESAFTFTTHGMTYADLAAKYSTFADLPDAPYSSPMWTDGQTALAIFNSSHQLQTLTGATATASMTTGEVGSDEAVSLLQSVRLRFKTYPTTSAIQTSFASVQGAGYTHGPSGTLNDGKFDLLKSARWHKAEFDFTGNVEVTHIEPKLKALGRR